MAITVLKHNATREERAQRGDTSRLTESYTVETDTDMTPTDVMDATFTGLPKIRTRHPTITKYVCVGVDVEPLTIRSWRLKAEYTGKHDSLTHARMTRRGGTREIPTWRVDTPTAPGDYDWFPTAPLSGAYSDINGEPETKRVWQHDLTLDVSIDVALVDFTYSHIADYWQALWTGHMLKRNSEPWMGYAVGAVVFLGWSEQMTEDPWITCSLQFRADQIYHLEQRVLPHVDGKILLQYSTTVAGMPIRQAGKVYWYQPYREPKVDFTVLWPVTSLTNPTPIYT